MSIKALRRRAREAHHWLGERCLPLWAEAGLAHGGGFVAALGMNHRTLADGEEVGGAASQDAMIALFSLAPRVGFDGDRADWLIETAQTARETAPAEDTVDPTGHRTLASDCQAFAHALSGALSADAVIGADELRTICDSFDTLMDDLLTLEGGWIAGYDAAGLPLADQIHTSLARHVVDALGPLLELAET